MGILIALLVNEWKTNRDNQRFLNQAMLSIAKEMKENLQKMIFKVMLSDLLSIEQDLLELHERFLAERKTGD